MPDYYKRRWDETRGDDHDEWGASWWLFEVDEDEYVVRQIEIYDEARPSATGRTFPRTLTVD